MAADGNIKMIFAGLPAATLNALLASYTQALTDISSVGQSYAVTGRSMTLANLAEIRQTLGEIAAALAQVNGTRVRRTFGNCGGFTR
jgi:hypothetical protein